MGRWPYFQMKTTAITKYDLNDILASALTETVNVCTQTDTRTDELTD